MKKYIVMTLLSLVGVSAGANAELSKVFKKGADGIISAPAVEFVHSKSGKKVLFVGMNHVGTEKYYQEVIKYVDLWAHAGDGKTVILREHFTCESSAYDILQTSPSEASIQELKKLDLTPQKVVRLMASQMDPFIRAFDLQKKACELDLDGLSKRPNYLVERNRKIYEPLLQQNGTVQFKDLKFIQDAVVTIGEGELQLDKVDPGSQFTSALLFRRPKINDAELSAAFDQIVGYALADYRNSTLMGKTMAALESGIARVVLPWGAAHIYDLKPVLLAAGFVQTGVHDIPMELPEDVKRGDIFRRMYDDVKHTGENYDF